MTKLLEQALEKVHQLPPAEQDAVAWDILHALEDEDAWAARFAQPSPKLRELLREAREEHARGETRPLDDLLE